MAEQIAHARSTEATPPPAAIAAITREGHEFVVRFRVTDWNALAFADQLAALKAVRPLADLLVQAIITYIRSPARFVRKARRGNKKKPTGAKVASASPLPPNNVRKAALANAADSVPSFGQVPTDWHDEEADEGQYECYDGGSEAPLFERQ